ncbi:DUF4349 domain-containing protein [Aeromicrobium marinum]|uniref:DUF4349 domain-containing protein n=1 Tax=Aeromicrobium marinum TaxID=219314 RepID=UPI00067FBEA4|nr:DUF4349 domain-containing protein [Aeromicrobium marinum]
MNTLTPLDDDRIATMRLGVMSAVDADLTRRGRRSRRLAGVTLAAVVVLGGGLAGLQLAGDDDAMTASDGFDTAAVAPDLAAPEALGGAEILPSTPMDEGATRELAAQDAVSDTDREVITTANAGVVVDDPREAAGDFSAWVEGAGGRIDARTDADEFASVTARVPAGQVTATLAQLEEYGEVETASVQRSDVTRVGANLDARIEALQVSVDRLTQILATAATSEQVIEAETALTQRQAELDGLRAERDALTDEVELSRVDVTFSASPRVETVEPDGFLGGLESGWNSVVSTVNAVVRGAGVVLPWASIGAALLLAFWWVRRLRHR